MTEPNPCSCESCDTCCPFGPLMRFEREIITRKIGCLSHPRAREVLMKDVVEELERRALLSDEAAQKTMPGSGHYSEALFMRACGKEEGLREAIDIVWGKK